MPNEVSREPAQSKSNEAAVAALAKDTGTSLDIVRALYEEECAALRAGAKVKTFVGVIATRNVKRYLRGLGAGAGH